MILTFEKAEIKNGRLCFDEINDHMEIPCVYCSENCEEFGKIQNLQNCAVVEICGDIKLVFREFFVEGERLTIERKR